MVETNRLISGLKLPEGIRWKDDRVWLSDIFNNRVLAIDLSGRSEIVATFDDRPSGLGFLADGTLLVALTRTRRIMRVTAGGVHLHADLSGLADVINDMVSGPDGRTYVGTGTSGQATYSILVVDPDGSASVAASGVARANGMTLTADQRHLIYGATDTRALMMMTVGDDGLLSNPTVFADLGAAVPDGVCLDLDGHVWVAAKDDGFILVAPGGEVLQRIPVHGGAAITCVLGGPERRTLCMAATHGTHAELSAAAAAGMVGDVAFVDVAEVAVPGAGWP